MYVCMYCQSKSEEFDQAKASWVSEKHRNILLWQSQSVSELSQSNDAQTKRSKSDKTPRKKAEIFNSYFSSVFQKSRVHSDNGDTDSAVRFPSDSELSEITVSEIEVKNYLRNLDGNKSHGPDEIHPRLLKKECYEQIGPSLCALFNHSLNCGRVPKEWKSANVST